MRSVLRNRTIHDLPAGGLRKEYLPPAKQSLATAVLHNAPYYGTTTTLRASAAEQNCTRSSAPKKPAAASRTSRISSWSSADMSDTKLQKRYKHSDIYYQ